MIISSVAIIDNRTARQVPIRETGGTANQRKQRRRDIRPISSFEEESKGDKAIDDAKITKIREQATKAAIRKSRWQKISCKLLRLPKLKNQETELKRVGKGQMLMSQVQKLKG